MPRLTKRTVDATRPAGRETFVWDDELPGFGLRVLSSGRRSYLVQYRAKGRTRRLTLGPHGVLTPEAARRRAIQVLADVRNGGDPSAVRHAERRRPTMAELAERYLREHAATKKKASSAAMDRRMLKKHVLPVLGPIRVADVTHADVSRFHHGLREHPYLANRVLALLSKMFNLAERWGLRPPATNPVRGIERYREKRRQRFLAGDELARLGQALAEAEAEGAELPSAIALVRLLLFTGCRRGEALGLRWEDVDFERGMAWLRDSKTGQPALVLNAPARAVLAGLERQGEWVFAGRDPEGPLVGVTRIWWRIRSRAELDDVRLHDLRHSHASMGAAAGLSLPLIGALLGHRQPATTARYAHLAADPVREASERVAARMAAALSAKPDAQVVELQHPERQTKLPPRRQPARRAPAVDPSVS